MLKEKIARVLSLPLLLFMVMFNRFDLDGWAFDCLEALEDWAGLEEETLW